MSEIRFAAVALAASLILAQAPAQAASPMTEAFMTNLEANLAILDASSRLAQGRTDDADLIAYAKDEADEAAQVVVALNEAAPADRGSSTTDVALLTGRSVAVAGMPGRVEALSDPVLQDPALEAANARIPATAALVTLEAQRGHAFERLFFVTQLDAMSQIESDYRTYLKVGDDPGIATMAREQLPVLMKRLEALTRL